MAVYVVYKDDMTKIYTTQLHDLASYNYWYFIQIPLFRRLTG